MKPKKTSLLNYKVVPFVFDIISPDIDSILNRISNTKSFEYETKGESPFIGNIEAHHYDAHNEKVFILIRGNYKNNKVKKILDNEKKEFEVGKKISAGETVTNEFIFVLDFGSCKNGEIYTDETTNIKRGFLFAFYEGPYALVRILTQYIEHQLLDKRISNIGNHSTKDKPLKEVKDLLSKIETDVVMSNGDGKQKKVGTFLVSPKSLFYMTEKTRGIQGVELDTRFVLTALEQTKSLLTDFSDNVRKKFPDISTNFVSNVRVKGKRRPFILDSETQSYVIKSFPAEETLSDNGQSLVHRIFTEETDSTTEMNNDLPQKFISEVMNLFSAIDIIKINKGF